MISSTCDQHGSLLGNGLPKPEHAQLDLVGEVPAARPHHADGELHA
jgi:hypothetical protein